MTFVEAVKSVYSNYANFRGRADRSEFWWFFLFYVLAATLLAMVDAALGTGGIFYGIFVLASLLPTLAVSVRRLHDTGKTGWWILIGLIPIVGAIVLIIFYVQPGQAGANRFGAAPGTEAHETTTPPQGEVPPSQGATGGGGEPPAGRS